jgi:hypothetical protein
VIAATVQQNDGVTVLHAEGVLVALGVGSAIGVGVLSVSVILWFGLLSLMVASVLPAPRWAVSMHRRIRTLRERG